MTIERCLELAKDDAYLSGRWQGRAQVSIRPLHVVPGQPGILALVFRTSLVPTPDDLADRVGCPRGGHYTVHPDDPKSGDRLVFVTDADLDLFDETPTRRVRPGRTFGAVLTGTVGTFVLAEVIARCALLSIPLEFGYVKQGTDTSEIRRAVPTWVGNPRSKRNPDGYGEGDVFGVYDLDRRAIRTFRLDGVKSIRPLEGEPVLARLDDGRFVAKRQGKVVTWRQDGRRYDPDAGAWQPVNP